MFKRSIFIFLVSISNSLISTTPPGSPNGEIVHQPLAYYAKEEILKLYHYCSKFYQNITQECQKNLNAQLPMTLCNKCLNQPTTTACKLCVDRQNKILQTKQAIYDTTLDQIDTFLNNLNNGPNPLGLHPTFVRSYLKRNNPILEVYSNEQLSEFQPSTLLTKIVAIWQKLQQSELCKLNQLRMMLEIILPIFFHTLITTLDDEIFKYYKPHVQGVVKVFNNKLENNLAQFSQGKDGNFAQYYVITKETNLFNIYHRFFLALEQI